MRRPLPERAFARLVRLLPRGFVAEYGADMTATFAGRAAEARRRGPLRFLWFLVRELAGLARVAVTEYAAGLRARRRDVGAERERERVFRAPGSARGAGERRPIHADLLPFDRRAPNPMEHLLREARHAARRLIRTPGFTAASVATLALAIGANTAIFALLHRVVLSPLPYPAAERLIALEHAAPGVGIPSGLGMSTGLYREYATLPSVEAIAMYDGGDVTLTGEDGAERLESLRTTPSLAGVLGVRPVLGRWFTEAEGEVGGPRVVVLTHGLWTRRFGASPAVLGSAIRLDGNAFEVVGVMPPDFAFPDDRPQLIVPLALDMASVRPGGFNYAGIARLRPGVDAAEARRQQDAVIADLPARFPGHLDVAQDLAGDVELGSLAEPLKDHVLGSVARTLWVLLGSVAIVLLIACANLANLFLVRAEAREREVAVRRALGAGTNKVAAYFLAETLLVALASGALGLWLGHVALEVLVLNGPIELPRLHEVRIDGVVVGFAALASLLAGLSFGLMPLARRLPAVASVLQDAGRGNTAGGSRMRARQALMATQVALAVVLVVSAGLMVQSFYRLQAVDPGFRADSRLVFRVGLPSSEYETAESAAAFHQLVLDRLEGLPGVRQVALTTRLPLDGGGGGDPLDVRGRPVDPGLMNPFVRFRHVSTDYFAAMAIPLREGRPFDGRDVGGRTDAVIINEALAGLYFPGEDAIGQRIRPIGGEADEGWLTVVGVVGNTATLDLREAAPAAKMYLPLHSVVPRVPSTHRAAYVLHAAGNPIALVPAVRRVLEELNPNVAIARPERLTDVVARAGARLAFTTVLLVLAGAVALLLGLVGVYAVISYGVAQRKGEIGVRLALGAPPGDVTGMIVRQSGVVVAFGVLLGAGAAVASTRLLRALLFGVAWNDPLTYAAAAAGLFGVAMLACWLPARRAARLDPLDSLR